MVDIVNKFDTTLFRFFPAEPKSTIHNEIMTATKDSIEQIKENIE